MYMRTSMYIYIYIYVYMYREREKERYIEAPGALAETRLRRGVHAHLRRTAPERRTSFEQ